MNRSYTGLSPAWNYLSFGASFSQELNYASFGPFRDSPFAKFNSGEKMDLSTTSKDYKNIPNYKRKLTKIYRFIKYRKKLLNVNQP